MDSLHRLLVWLREPGDDPQDDGDFGQDLFAAMDDVGDDLLAALDGVYDDAGVILVAEEVSVYSALVL